MEYLPTPEKVRAQKRRSDRRFAHAAKHRGGGQIDRHFPEHAAELDEGPGVRRFVSGSASHSLSAVGRQAPTSEQRCGQHADQAHGGSCHAGVSQGSGSGQRAGSLSEGDRVGGHRSTSLGTGGVDRERSAGRQQIMKAIIRRLSRLPVTRTILQNVAARLNHRHA
jgi:hypothetical protein